MIDIQKRNATIAKDNAGVIICKHCGKPIKEAQLIGISLICPSCGKPQNGIPRFRN
jgi:Zn finger protein HypA/HybF involved in hydrogenase expression